MISCSKSDVESESLLVFWDDITKEWFPCEEDLDQKLLKTGCIVTVLRALSTLADTSRSGLV